MKYKISIVYQFCQKLFKQQISQLPMAHSVYYKQFWLVFFLYRLSQALIITKTIKKITQFN